MNRDKPKSGPAPRWKKLAIIFAAIVLLAGLGLKVSGWVSRSKAPSPTARSSSPPPPGGQGLVAGGPQAGSSPNKDADPPPGLGEQASPVFLAGGASFFAGLAVGTALRAIYKVALLVTGVLLLGLFGLSYSGAIGPIPWDKVNGTVEAAAAKVQERVAGIQNSLLVTIPSAGMAGAGLVSGIKRR